MDGDNNSGIAVLDSGTKMKKLILNMTPEHPTHSILFGAVTSLFCFVFAKYSHPILLMSGFDMMLTRFVAILGICTALTTMLSFYLKHEKRIDRWWSNLRDFFNRWF